MMQPRIEGSNHNAYVQATDLDPSEYPDARYMIEHREDFSEQEIEVAIDTVAIDEFLH